MPPVARIRLITFPIKFARRAAEKSCAYDTSNLRPRETATAMGFRRSGNGSREERSRDMSGTSWIVRHAAVKDFSEVGRTARRW